MQPANCVDRIGSITMFDDSNPYMKDPETRRALAVIESPGAPPKSGIPHGLQNTIYLMRALFQRMKPALWLGGLAVVS
jgi:hypothetical protein